MSKKTRGPNFSSNEKEILVHLVTKYKEIVENKKTDAVTTSTKIEGWSKLTEEFNALSSFCVRNTEQLKTCWENVKRNARKDKAATKKQIFLTGGGRPDIPPQGPLQGQVEILLGPSLDGLDNPYDSDFQFSDQTVSNNIEIIKVAETQGDNTDDGTSSSYAGPSQVPKPSEDENLKLENPDKNVWCNWTPKVLKTKVSNALSSDRKDMWLCRRRPKTSLQDKVLQSKLGLIETMKKNADAEAALKEKILEEQLRQEKIKTEMLQIELEEIKNRNKDSA